jgi:hypothetical protein
MQPTPNMHSMQPTACIHSMQPTTPRNYFIERDECSQCSSTLDFIERYMRSQCSPSQARSQCSPLHACNQCNLSPLRMILPRETSGVNVALERDEFSQCSPPQVHSQCSPPHACSQCSPPPIEKRINETSACMYGCIDIFLLFKPF